uniref:Peptidase S9 prolyl oligopeptidase catalytic domain-containing protein n=1 Tax=Araucaria cunninghamii TaxID=56994 RepID=A0A0D6R138_ARACU
MLSAAPAKKKAKGGEGDRDYSSSAMPNSYSHGNEAHGSEEQKERGEEEVEELQVQDIAQNPLPGCGVPGALAFTHDDALISYLHSSDGTLHRKLYVFDPSTGTHELVVSPPGGGVEEWNLSSADKMRRERMRERGLGVTRYEWAKTPHLHRLMVPLPGGIYVQDLPGKELFLILESTSSSPILDPQLSPDGSMIAYARDDEIYVLPVTCGESKQITFGARGTGKMHGLAEYIAQEEMERRNGFWWSPDSKHIAFTQVDASEIPIYKIMHQGKATVGREAEEDHAYPFAGHANVKVRLGIVPATGGDISWMDLSCGLSGDDAEEEYLARVAWMKDTVITAQVLNRVHSKLKLLKFDVKSGARETVLIEESDIWVNLHDCFTPLHKGLEHLAGGFIWASERSGFRHLYLYDGHGHCLGAITEGEWMVEQVAAVDENAGVVYFTGTLDSPLEAHLYSTKLFPDFSHPLQKPKKLTQGEGKHSVVLDHQMQRFIDIHDSLKSLPRVALHSLQDGRLLMPIYEQPSPTPRVQRLLLSAPEIVKISASDGTSLYGAIYRPSIERFGPPPYRTLVNVYGGPHVQTVCKSWINTVDMRAQYLCSRGFLVWRLDNRGSARRGLRFEGALKYNVGHIDVEDQETGVEWLVQQKLAKPGKIGVYGWSYGGYMAAMTLARCPDTFQCAVAGAPVTSWDGYDTFYTEKYMGLPASNPAGFEYSSVMHHVPRIRGKLLLVHGMIDENVHFRHTARLVNAFIAAGKEYELLIFPDERHMPRRLRDRIYMEEKICNFIDRNL